VIEQDLMKNIAMNTFMPDHEDVPNPIPLTFGIYYTFKKAGVKIISHEHPPGKGHYCVVLTGRVKFTKGDKISELEAGDLVSCPDGIAHEIEALEPMTRIINGNFASHEIVIG
jgi:quercetin dioxygenase-like cupin family protein